MTEARDIRTIVVGVDGSDASVEALRQAQGLAVPLSATLVALAVVPPLDAQSRTASNGRKTGTKGRKNG